MIRRRRAGKRTHLQEVRWLAFLCGVPGTLAALLFLYLGDYPPKVYATTLVLVLGSWMVLLLALQQRIIRPLQTASNMLSALREGDFSLQAGYVHPDDPLGQVMLEINQLTAVLQSHRMGRIDASNLLQAVVREIDVAVFTFSTDQRLQMVNEAGAQLLGKPSSDLLGRPAEELGLALCLELAPGDRCLTATEFPGRRGRWAVKRGNFRQDGRPHTLLLMADVSRELREEELSAWKRLIRILGHELNNSLSPITSVADSLRRILAQPTLPADWKEDLVEGLSVIGNRADSLSRFMREYSQLARLPPPHRNWFRIRDLVASAVRFYGSTGVPPGEGPDIEVWVDGAQIEQVLINLVKNAVEASRHTGASVRVGWQVEGKRLLLLVEDEGEGIANPDNLFIPFFSTKPGGSGIGLTLSRQIIENHGGELTLRNRTDRSGGARAEVLLPLLSPPNPVAVPEHLSTPTTANP